MKSRSWHTVSISRWKVWAAFLRPKGGWQELVESERRNHCHLVDVFRHHRDLVVALDEVHLRKNSASIELGWEILQMGHRVLVFIRRVVEAVKVAASPPPISLGHHVQRQGPTAFRSADHACPHHILESSLGRSELIRRKSLCPSEDWLTCREDLEDDPVLCHGLGEMGYQELRVACLNPIQVFILRGL